LTIGFGNLKWIIISFRMKSFLFKSFIYSCIDFRSSLLPPLARRSHIRMVFPSKFWANFSIYFSFMLERQTNANFPIKCGGHVNTFPLLSKMFHLSHSRRIVSQRLKTRSKRRKMLMYSFINFTLNTCFNISSKCYMMNRNKKIKKVSKSNILRTNF
jgi:hypothetical protein